MANLTEVSSNTTVSSNPAYVHSVSLTAGSDQATLELRDNGSSGTKKVTIKAAANATESHTFAEGAEFFTDVHATISGTSPVASVEWT